METRRIRRLERRRTRRVALAIIALAGLGVAIGLALPRNPFASALLSSAAITVLVFIALRGDAIAPTHGLHRVVRLPMQSAVSSTLESFWSRFAGTTRALSHVLVGALPRSTPVPLDLEELDDEAEAWWGAPRDHLMSNIDGDGSDDQDFDEPPRTPSRARRVGAGLLRPVVGTRRLFTRTRGEPNVASDGTSSDAVEAGTLSARST